MKISRIDLINLIRKTGEIIKEYSNTMMVFATFILALATCDLSDKTTKMADETRKMADETKAMADLTKRSVELSEEQFKIRAYPTFILGNIEISIDPNNVLEKFAIQNLGEISAFKVTLLQIYIFENNSRKVFSDQITTYYEGPEANTSVDFEKSIPSKTTYNLINKITTPTNVNINQLKHKIIFVRFKVPLDNTYKYESFGYHLTKTPDKEEEKATWQEATAISKKLLIYEYFKTKDDTAIRIGSMPKVLLDPFSLEGKISDFFKFYSKGSDQE